MPAVELSVPAGADHVRVARLVAVATARVAGVDESLLDDVRLAVDEASCRAVRLNAEQRPDTPIRIVMETAAGRFSVTVFDAVPHPDPPDDPVVLGLQDVDALPSPGALQQPASGEVAGERTGVLDTVLPDDFGLAMVRGLVDDVQVSHDGSGCEVRMSWPADTAPVQ